MPDDPQAGFGKADNTFPVVKNVRVVKDKEIVRVGSLAVQMHNTAGHKPGSTTWTWQSCDQFRQSITMVGELPCDIMVITHLMATDVAGKLKKRVAEAKKSESKS